ncbi:hypothetical protein [Bacillus cihuensis]|uniref:hypothetical protein n=1 Tax=Bacillus cihuensis TaxID=1208599 RepID=UPI00048B377C|nr:hypothetical protein [Bacillus cihuensis]
MYYIELKKEAVATCRFSVKIEYTNFKKFIESRLNKAPIYIVIVRNRKLLMDTYTLKISDTDTAEEKGTKIEVGKQLLLKFPGSRIIPTYKKLEIQLENVLFNWLYEEFYNYQKFWKGQTPFNL